MPDSIHVSIFMLQNMCNEEVPADDHLGSAQALQEAEETDHKAGVALSVEAPDIICGLTAAERHRVELGRAEHAVLGHWLHQRKHGRRAGEQVSGDSHPGPAQPVRDHPGEGQQSSHRLQHHVRHLHSNAAVAFSTLCDHQPSSAAMQLPLCSDWIGVLCHCQALREWCAVSVC